MIISRTLIYSAIRAFLVAGFLFALLSYSNRAAAQGVPATTSPLNSWSFYDTNAWPDDNGYSPVSLTNLNASIYGDGTALVLDSTNTAWLQYPVYENNGATNLTVNLGSVTLWFAPNWASTNAGGFGSGAWGNLINVGQWTTNAAYGWWSLYVDPAGANLYFSAQNNSGTQTNYLAAPIAWTSNQWHFIALTYSANNTLLYLDGQLATNGLGMTIWPNANVLSNGFFIGSDAIGAAQAHGMFDDIFTYNFVVDSNTIGSTFLAFKPAYYLLDSWSFNDTNAWTSDNGYAPVSFTNLAVSLLGDGTAVVVDSTNAAWLQYNVVESDGRTNLTVNQGSVAMWFSPDWASTNAGGFGSGAWGQLLTVGQWTSDASYGWWSLYTDPAGVNLYFSAQGNSGAQTNYLAVPISWTTNRWHFIVLNYSATNTVLYLDGLLATNGVGISIVPSANVLSNGFYIGSDTNGMEQAHGIFDDIYTYSIPLDATTISNEFAYEFVYWINPLNAGNDIGSAQSSPGYTPTYDVITGQGNLLGGGSASSCSYGTNAYNVWITNVTATVSGTGSNNMSLTFTIEGGADNVPYDVFVNNALVFGVKTMPWAWMGQGYHCNIYTITNLPNTACFLILGTPLDTSGDGLTDAYERLVMEANPAGSQFDSYGVPLAWYAEQGLNPFTSILGGQDPDTDGLLNYQEYLYGTKPLTSEGFSIWVSTPEGTSGIP